MLRKLLRLRDAAGLRDDAGCMHRPCFCPFQEGFDLSSLAPATSLWRRRYCLKPDVASESLQHSDRRLGIRIDIVPREIVPEGPRLSRCAGVALSTSCLAWCRFVSFPILPMLLVRDFRYSSFVVALRRAIKSLMASHLCRCACLFVCISPLPHCWWARRAASYVSSLMRLTFSARRVVLRPSGADLFGQSSFGAILVDVRVNPVVPETHQAARPKSCTPTRSARPDSVQKSGLPSEA